MKDLKPQIEKLLQNQLSQKEWESFLKTLQKLIKRVFNQAFTPQIEKLFIKYYGSDYLDDLSQEVIKRLLLYKETLLKLDFLNELYLMRTISNVIYLHLSSEFKLIEKEKNLEELATNDPEEGEEINFLESFSPVFVNYLCELKIQDLLVRLDEALNEKEKETLCLYLLKLYEKAKGFSKKEMNLHYKRWERLKPKLKELLADLDLEDQQEVSEFWERVLSEICKKGGYVK